MFEGLSVAMVTPWKAGVIDQEGTARLVEHMIAGGVEGIVVSGSTGEAATTTFEERRALWTLVKERARGRVWVVAGTGTNSTAESIANTALAEELGLDGAMVVTPYYNKPTPKGQVAHFRAVAQSTKLPLLLYNVPGRTATNTRPETLALVQDLPNVKAVKEASGDLDQMSQVKTRTSLTLLSGDDSLTLACAAVGGEGIVSVAGQVAPRPMRELSDHCRAGRWREARAVHERLQPLFKAMFIESNPGPVKYALSAMGLIGNDLRLPLVPVEAATEAAVREALKAVGIAVAEPARA